jgi:hypothetical protein
MSAIITTKFRYQNANTLVQGLNGTLDDVYYLFIGRSFAWTSDSSPPTPDDSQYHEYDAQQNILALKKLAATNVTRAIPRYNWISGSTYSEYDDRDSALSTKQYFVVTDELSVYKCIKAGSGGSSIKPTGSSTSIGSVLADGYQWKYMYTLSGSDVAKFNTASFIAVKTLETDDDSVQWDVQQAALPGAIHRIKITSGGSGYTTKPTVTITGDGEGCTVIAADVTISGGAVTEILVNSARCGHGYSNATVSLSGGTSGTPATARAVISPPGGHGADAVGELGSFYVMVDVQLVADEGSGDFLVDNDFRQIGLVANPYETDSGSLSLLGKWVTGTEYVTGDTVYVDGMSYVANNDHTAAATFAADLPVYWDPATVANSATLNALTTITYSGLVGTLAKDQNVTGSTSTAVGYVDSIDTGDLTIKFHQNSTTGYKSFEVGETITIGTATATIDSITAPEYVPVSGKLVYVENLSPVNRNISQTEDIKLVLEL